MGVREVKLQMKNIVFTIKTAYSEEDYFLIVDENKDIELQIANALAKISFCDSYEIIDYKEVTNDYIEERNTLIAEYKKKYESIEDDFCSSNMVTLESLKDII